jgi:hypothetical protein
MGRLGDEIHRELDLGGQVRRSLNVGKQVAATFDVGTQVKQLLNPFTPDPDSDPEGFLDSVMARREREGRRR